MIVVTMTSWVKRICNVKSVVESIMNNTLLPDRVYLNLSKTEFDGITLPEDLVTYFNSDNRLIINWIDGENTKSMKKIFPILKYLDDDDIIIGADDDILFPRDLIESRVNDFNNNEKKYPITSNKCLAGISFPDMYVASALSLYTKKFLNNWERYVNDTVIKTYNDDRTYLYILWLNGYKNKPCSKNEIHNILKTYDMNLRETSMSVNHIHKAAKNYDIAVDERVKRLCGKSISESFGFFNKKKYDCVLIYGKSGLNSKEMTCGDHLEIEYVIASLKKYCSSWLGRIFVVGSEPPESIRKDVIHISCDDPYTHCKDANIIHKIRYACENISDLSDDFLVVSDDQIVTRESSWDDMKPRIVRRYTDWSEEKWKRNRRVGFWQECLYQTLNHFGKSSCVWEPHIWSPMNKHKFIEMCKKYDYEHNIGCIMQSLYYNSINQEPVKQFDHTHLSDKKALKIIQTLSINNLDRHLSWTDTAFSQEKFRRLLDKIVGFDESGETEVKTSEPVHPAPSRIQQLREDIKEGKVIRVTTKNGFIWKRVR